MIVITSNGLSSDRLLNELFPYTQPLRSAAIVKTASNPFPDGDESLPELMRELQMLRLRVDLFDFDTDDPAALLQYDVVEMSGGDPFYLRRSIRKAAAEQILRQIAREKLLIGVSAGAIVQQQNMRLIAEFAAETGRITPEEQTGIGLVSHEIMPHYGQFCARYFRVEERIRQYELETGCRVIRLSDGEGFFCKNIG